ncbi:GntR family transcriptional regulator [Roseinatronobacter alkalisoli]|uniref:GntR family transcriptional regulator n=1 Tax=Roseinatronobacter alkalisoli TaxID=3028235 RepID=A0ABT5TF85_9RHOB|nr:GntR family transcriptional regulator [Roseinatronobacter sp. HJB301]MDD7973778.1 GntR family transcriptional regulator [Roseinatronobacter sp. HJB301]
MARSDARYREAYNTLLDHCATLPPGAVLPAESALSAIAGVSRTVIRRCLSRLEETGLISWDGRDKRILRTPAPEDRIVLADGHGASDDLERRFLDWILRFDVPANTPLSVAELSRNFDVPQHELKEFLAGLSRFGLVARRKQGGWMLLGFTREFAVELSDFRTVLELNAISHVIDAPVDHPVWPRLREIRAAHLALRSRIDTDFHEFSKLDEAFHEAVNSVVKNRFVAEFQKVISLIFHYHYMWDKTHEKIRNAAAIGEHLAIIDALEARDGDAARDAARRHLKTSKTTLLSSLRAHEFA